MRGVVGEEMMFLKMHKGPGKLNEALIKAAVRVVALEPQMLQNIVRFIVLPAIKAEEKGPVLDWMRGGRFRVPIREPGVHAFVFFHSP